MNAARTQVAQRASPRVKPSNRTRRRPATPETGDVAYVLTGEDQSHVSAEAKERMEEAMRIRQHNFGANSAEASVTSSVYPRNTIRHLGFVYKFSKLLGISSDGRITWRIEKRSKSRLL